MKGPGISRFTYKRNYRGSGERHGRRTCTGLQLQDVHAVPGRAGRCRAGVRHGSAENGIRVSRGRHRTKKAPLAVFRQAGRESSGDLLSRTRGPGTIGDLRLNFRVRDGNGCDPHSITAETNSCMEPKLFCNRQNAEARRVRAAHAGQ